MGNEIGLVANGSDDAATRPSVAPAGRAAVREIDDRLVAACERAARGLAWTTVSIGAAVCLGWMIGSDTLKSVLPGYPTMKINTAGGLLMAGLALRAAVRGAPPLVRRLGVALAALVGLDGVLALVQYALGVDVGIDQLVAHDLSLAAGRMAPMTAVAFVLAGAALLLIDVELAGFLVGASLAAICLVLAWLRLVAVLFGGSTLLGNPLWATMAIHTAAGFVCLALGVIVARPQRGGMLLFVSKGVGATTARRFVPAAILVPLLLGGLTSLGASRGFYDERYRAAMVVIGMTVVLVALLISHGHTEDAADLARRDAEARVALGEQRWRTIAEQVTDVVARHRLDGTIVYVSAAARSVMGYEPAELIGHSAFDVLIAEDVPLVEQEVRAAAASGRTHLVRFRIRHKERRTIWLESTFRIVPSLEAPDAPEIVAVSRDVTAQVDIERMRTDFIAMLSHDLKNPLGVLASYLEILEHEPDEATRSDVIARMRRNIDSATRLAVNMVDAIRIDSGSLPVVRVPSSLDAIVRDVVRRQENGARLKNVVLDLRCGGLPAAPVDAALIERALENLIANAIKFAPAGSRVEVETRIERGEACIAVRDHGPGIRAHAEATLFQRFQRDADRYHDSSGLGLFIVRSIAEAHGGSAVYDSPGGDGSRFCIHLPLDDAQTSEHRVDETASSPREPAVVAARRP